MSDGALTKFLGGGKVAVQTDRAALMKAIREDLAETGDASRGGGNLFLNFSGKKGVYSLGKKKSDMDPETPYVVAPSSMARGWVFWANNKVSKRHRWLLTEPKNRVKAEDLEDLPVSRNSDGWKAERSFIARNLEDGVQIEFSTSTVSAVNSIGDLLDEVMDHEEDEAYLPIIGFDKTTFEAHGETNFKPVFEIMAWVSEADLVAFEAEEVDIDDLLAEGVEEEPEVIETKPKPKAKKRAAKKKAAPARPQL